MAGITEDQQRRAKLVIFMLNLCQVSSHALFFWLCPPLLLWLYPSWSRTSPMAACHSLGRRCRCLSWHQCVFRCVLGQRRFEGLIPHPWLTIAVCAPPSHRNRNSKDNSSTGSSPNSTWAAESLPILCSCISPTKHTNYPHNPFFL